MSNYYNNYSGNGQGGNGNPRFQGQSRGQQYPNNGNKGNSGRGGGSNFHPLQASNAGNAMMNDGDYGSYPVQAPPRAPGGVYNPNDITISKYDSINADRHFTQNRQGLGNGDIVSQPDRLEDYYNQNQKLSVEQEPNIKYVLKERYLTISSKDRNISSFPQPENYVVHLSPASDSGVESAAVGEIYRNVVSVELLGGVIPDQGNVTDEPYLLLHINELENTFEGSNKDLRNAFAVLQMQTPVTAGKFMNLNDQLYKTSKKTFNPPISQLSRLTLRISDLNGDDFSWGDDSGGPNSQFQHFFMFKIIERVVDNKDMQSRALF